MKFLTTVLLVSASAISVLAAPLGTIKRDGSTEFDADLAVLKRDGSTEFDADLAVLKRTVVETVKKDKAKRDGSTEFDADLAVL